MSLDMRIDIIPYRDEPSDLHPTKRTTMIMQEWLMDHSVNVLEWPSQSLRLNKIEHFWRNLEMSIGPSQPDRALKVKR